MMLSLNSQDEYRDRVYIALYGPADPSKKSPESFQWAFHVSPKSAPHGSFQTAKYQLKKNTVRRSDGTQKTRWSSEQEFGFSAGPEELVVEVQIGGIRATRYEFEECLRQVNIKQDDPSFDDRVWVQQALSNLANEQVLTKQSIVSWETIEKTIVKYYLQQVEQGATGSEIAPYNLMPCAIAT